SVTERRGMALTVVRPTIAGPTSCSRRALTAATDPRRADGMSVVPLRWGAAPGTGSEPSGGEGGEGGAPRLRARLLREQQLQQQARLRRGQQARHHGTGLEQVHLRAGVG